ncbi:MAG: hypothetical protein Q9181_002809 [Wetmoreana brouardii]
MPANLVSYLELFFSLQTGQVRDFNYEKSIGFRSTELGSSKQPLEVDTVLSIASCTKLMTAIAALQCVERELLALDDDASKFLPELGGINIITDIDEATGKPLLKPAATKITLR